MGRVVFRTRADNERMKSVLARVGFVPTQIYYEKAFGKEKSGELEPSFEHGRRSGCHRRRSIPASSRLGCIRLRPRRLLAMTIGPHRGAIMKTS